jgi:hypothetical protein
MPSNGDLKSLKGKERQGWSAGQPVPLLPIVADTEGIAIEAGLPNKDVGLALPGQLLEIRPEFKAWSIGIGAISDFGSSDVRACGSGIMVPKLGPRFPG